MFIKDTSLSKISKSFVHAKVFFEMMNINEYVDVDKFDSDKPVCLHDMNMPVLNDLRNRFSLLLDGGTIEHIFDVRQVMTNAIDMLKIGGYVVHISSFTIDHGFYAFSPCFFFDLYQTNGFDNLACYVMQVDFRKINRTYLKQNVYFEYQYGMRFEGLIDASKQILVFFVARKARAFPRLQLPTQGIFDSNRASNSTTAPKKIRRLQLESMLPKKLKGLYEVLRPLAGFVARTANRHQQLAKIKKI